MESFHQTLTQHCVIAAKIAGEFLLHNQQRIGQIKINEKSTNQLVTEIDIEAEKIIISYLQSHYPDASFVGEENTVLKPKVNDLQFIIDPLDGTTNFLHGLPMYSVSIAATFHQVLVSGVVFIPVLAQCFYATKNGGAFLNNQAIEVSCSKVLSESLLATGFPYHNFKQMNEYLNCLKYLMENTRGLRRMGSAAIDLAYTASGNFCGFFELNLNTWDVAAGALLVKEAGGIYSNIGGDKFDISGKSIIAANPYIYTSLQTLLLKELKQ